MSAFMGGRRRYRPSFCLPCLTNCNLPIQIIQANEQVSEGISHPCAEPLTILVHRLIKSGMSSLPEYHMCVSSRVSYMHDACLLLILILSPLPSRRELLHRRAVTAGAT
jgi:hypothetical protein